MAKTNEQALENVEKVVQAWYDKALENAEEHQKGIKEAETPMEERNHTVLLGQAYGIRNLCEFLIKYIDAIKKGENPMDAVNNIADDIHKQMKEDENKTDFKDDGTVTAMIRVMDEHYEKVSVNEKDDYWKVVATAGDGWFKKTEDIFIKTLNENDRKKVQQFCSEQTVVLSLVLKAAEQYTNKNHLSHEEAEKVFNENMERYSKMFKTAFKKEVGEEIWKKFIKATAETDDEAPKNCYVFDVEKEIKLL